MKKEIFSDYGVAVLAAGTSTRMGKIKQLLPWGETSLIGHVVRMALGSGAGTVAVVLGAHGDLIQKEIHGQPVEFLRNPDFVLGQGTSIRAAAAWAVEKKLRGLLIILCDQPFLTSRDFKIMLGLAVESPSGLIASRYPDGVGVPVLFSSETYGELLNVPDDQGAKYILKKNSHRIIEVNFENSLSDIDTPEEYEKAKSSY